MSIFKALLSEAVVLGWMMLDKHLARRGLEALEPEMFYQEDHRIIFSVCRRSPGPIDSLGVIQALEQAGRLGEVGRKRVFEIAANITQSENFGLHVAEVRKAFYARKIYEAAKKIADNPDDTDTFSKMTESVMLRNSEGADEFFRFDRDLPEYAEWATEKKDRSTVIDVGIAGIDALLGGVARGDLFTISGRPGGGKTALMSKMVVRFAENGLKVCVFPTEMSDFQFVDRIVPARSGIKAWKFRRKEISTSDAESLSAALGVMAEKFKVFVVDKPRPSLDDVARAVSKIKPDVVVLDYLQRFAKPEAENHTRSVDSFMTSLKSLCLEHGVVGVLGCQMNRTVDREDSPRLSDLRDSGAIEAESDQVLLLQTKKHEESDRFIPIAGHIEKNRHGRTGVVDLWLDRDFVDISDEIGGVNAIGTNADGSPPALEGGPLRPQGPEAGYAGRGNGKKFGRQADWTEPRSAEDE